MMTLLNVDHEKCKQDGLCANDCPAGVIFFKPGQYPELKRGAEAMCLRCGHCVAICPHGAMDHAEVPLADCPPIDPALSVTPDQAVQFLRSRRSVRRFKPGPVEQADIQRLIDIGRYAPTASNAQVLRWMVINDKSLLDALAGQVIEWMRAVVASGEGVTPYMPVVIKAWDKGFNPILPHRSLPGGGHGTGWREQRYDRYLPGAFLSGTGRSAVRHGHLLGRALAICVGMQPQNQDCRGHSGEMPLPLPHDGRLCQGALLPSA